MPQSSSMEQDLTGLNNFFSVSVHHLIREKHAPIPVCCFWILQCKKETLPWFSTHRVELGAWQQLPLVCWVLPGCGCIGLGGSTAGEAQGQPHVPGAAKGWVRSARSICNTGFGIAALVTNGQVQQPVGPGCRPSFKNQTPISISTSKIKPTYWTALKLCLRLFEVFIALVCCIKTDKLKFQGVNSGPGQVTSVSIYVLFWK